MQNYKHKRLLMTFIIALTTVPIFSTDMYLPALPTMVALFGVPLKLVNLTLVLFLIFFAGSTLIWGTMSDKYGRRPILLIAITAYTLAGFGCATAATIHSLIVFRALQGIGGGAAAAISMAVVKDLFSGRQRERLLVYQGSLMSIAPIVAPIVGAQMLLWTSWRGTFVVLTFFGILLLLGTLFYRESAPADPNKSVAQTLGNLGKLVMVPAFVLPLAVFSVVGLPILMYVGGSADIYISHFGLSERLFSFYFGFNALFSVVAPFGYIVLSRHIKAQTIIVWCFAGVALSGVCLIVWGPAGPVPFALSCVPASLALSLMRPPCMNILLEQGKEDAGAASSLMNFCFIAGGCLAMVFISLEWQSRILVFGLTNLLCALFALALWPLTWRKINSAARLQQTD